MGNNQCCSTEVETKRELFDQVPQGIKASLSQSNSENYSINICENEQVEVFRSGINLIRRPISNIKQLIEETLQSYSMQLPRTYLQPAQFHQEVRVALEMIFSSEEMTENLLQRETQQYFKTHGNYCYVSNKYLHRGEPCVVEPQNQQSPSRPQHQLSQHQFVFETPSKDKLITQENSKPGLNSTPFIKFPKTQDLSSNGEEKPYFQKEKQTSKRLELSVSRQENSQLDNSLANSPYFEKQLDTEQVQKSNRDDQHLSGIGSAIVMEHSFAFIDQNNHVQK